MAKRKKRAATSRSSGKSGRQRNVAPAQSGELLGSAGLLQNGGPREAPHKCQAWSSCEAANGYEAAQRCKMATWRQKPHGACSSRARGNDAERRRADRHHRKIRSQLTRHGSADRFARLTENCNVHAKSCLDGHADYAGHRDLFDLDSLERRSFGMGARHRLSCQRSRPHSDLVLAWDSAADPTASVNDKTTLASPPSSPQRRNPVLIKSHLCPERTHHR